MKDNPKHTDHHFKKMSDYKYNLIEVSTCEEKSFINLLRMAHALHFNLYRTADHSLHRVYEQTEELKYKDFGTLEEVYEYLQSFLK